MTINSTHDNATKYNLFDLTTPLEFFSLIANIIKLEINVAIVIPICPYKYVNNIFNTILLNIPTAAEIEIPFELSPAIKIAPINPAF